MLFNSLEFLAFLIIFLGLWPLLRGQRNRRWIGIVAASFFFYGWWDWRFCFLLIGSGLVDFFAAGAMLRYPHRKKFFLLVSIAANLGTLATFKYLDFAIDNLNALLPALGIDSQLAPMRLMLPIGISFYTFQSMSYTIDVYRGQIAPTRNVLHFFAYLAMSDAPPHPGPRPAREREHSLLTFSDRFQLHDEFPLHDWSPTY